MIKVDLHLHTVSTISDTPFEFSITKLEEYVQDLNLHCIAITNHNRFDREQFEQIQKSLDCLVLPGVEVDLENGHILVIADGTDLDEFEKSCNILDSMIVDNDDSLELAEFRELFKPLEQYILIPHYDKKPSIKESVLKDLGVSVTAGEVASQKKWIYSIKNELSLVPVLFSDQRFHDEMISFSPRQTFLNTEEVTFNSIKYCLQDKRKVFLNESDGHNLFQALEEGVPLSTGLNVILGARSSGKSYTLKRIASSHPNVKYVKQFELVEKDEEADKKRFNQLLSTKRSSVSGEYLKEFKSVVEDINTLDIDENLSDISKFLSSLLKVAKEEEKRDVFSKCLLFDASKLTLMKTDGLKKLIDSTTTFLENTTYEAIITKHVQRRQLVSLILELITLFRENELQNRKAGVVNELLLNIKRDLRAVTASTAIEDVDLYKILLDNAKIKKFQDVVRHVQTERTINSSDVRRFKVVAGTKKYAGAQELLDKFGHKAKFSNAFAKYTNAVEYLKELKAIETLPSTEYHKYFVNIRYEILNEHGTPVSGGERSEFNLLEKIQNSHQYDMLLIDEPEASFDNLFLRKEVNEIIKEIAKQMPVVVVTHNSTVGASISPDHVVYTEKTIVNGNPEYNIYFGSVESKELVSVNGSKINTYTILMDSLEGGENSYNGRNTAYETLRN